MYTDWGRFKSETQARIEDKKTPQGYLSIANRTPKQIDIISTERASTSRNI